MEIMNLIEKRDFIHSHLHQVDEAIINAMYSKIYSRVKKENPVVGYEPSGEPFYKNEFIARIKESEAEIERGEYLTIEELEKESEQW